MDALLQEVFMLSALPSVQAKEILSFLIQRILKLSGSEIGVFVFDQFFCSHEHSDTGRTNKSPTVPSVRRATGFVDGRFIPLSVSTNHPLKGLADDGLPYLMSCSKKLNEYALNNESDMNLVTISRLPLWFVLSDGYRTFGWCGLGMSEDGVCSESAAQSIQELLSAGMVALHRWLLRNHGKSRGLDINLVGRSESFLEFERRLKRAAQYNGGPVLITGERGTGKELAAYAIHFFSSRKNKPFIPVLASAFCESLHIDELFGHERGSFTGAGNTRKGKFLAADEGTIFFDEVADLPNNIQISLLRVIERGEIQHIGRDALARVNVRVITATNKDLTALVAEGSFRPDLYDRLNVIQIQTPPLRERRSDIPILVDYFLKWQCLHTQKRLRVNRKLLCEKCDKDCEVKCATQEFRELLQRYNWPGNIRELQNLITHLTAMSFEEILDTEHLPEQIRNNSLPPEGAGGPALKDLRLESVIKRHIENVLKMSVNNQTYAAKLLGIPRTTLQAKMRKYFIN